MAQKPPNSFFTDQFSRIGWKDPLGHAPAGRPLEVYSSLVMKLSAHDLDWPGKNSAPLYSEGMKPVIGITFLSP